MGITNNTPLVIHNGIDDDSVPPLVSSPDSSPIHLPLFYMQSEKGPIEPVKVSGGDLVRLYGAETINARGKYFNHATQFVITTLGSGNSCYIKRVTSATSALAKRTLMLSIDSTTGVINEYDREVDGTIKTDVDGNRLFLTTTVSGGMKVKLYWVDDVTSTVPVVTGDVTHYPVLTIKSSSIGESGNRTGLRLWAADAHSIHPGDTEIMSDQKTFLYNAQLMQREVNSTNKAVDDLYNANYQEFAFKSDCYDFKTNLELNIDKLITQYSDDGVLYNNVITEGPLGSVEVHSDNLELALNRLVLVENILNGTDYEAHEINWLNGTDYYNVPYYAWQLDSSSVKFSNSRTHLLTGGLDGDTSLTAFNEAVIYELDANYNSPEHSLLDRARYPFSVIYDSGFPIPVKKKIMQWLGYRPDVHVGVTTYVEGEDVLTNAEEISVSSDLKSHAMTYTESDVHGTSVCRMTMVAGEGTYISSGKRVGLLLELVSLRARYLGAGDGRVKVGSEYGNGSTNKITLTKNIHNTWRSNLSKNVLWNTGSNYVQYYDKHQLHFPAIQTVYDVKRSTLTNDLTMQVCVDVTKQCDKVWRDMTGDTRYTVAQFIEKCDKLLLELVDGKYSDLARIVPNATMTATDTNRGYSWTMNVTIYSNVMRTVATVNIITKRFAQLNNIIN